MTENKEYYRAFDWLNPTPFYAIYNKGHVEHFDSEEEVKEYISSHINEILKSIEIEKEFGDLLPPVSYKVKIDIEEDK